MPKQYSGGDQQISMIELCLGAFHTAVAFLTVIRVRLEVLESQMHDCTDKNLQN